MEAKELVTRLRAELAPVASRMTAHPWLHALEAGALPAAALRAFAGEQLQVIPADLRSAVALAQRYAGQQAEGFLRGMARTERAALPAIGAFATAVGLTGALREDYEPIAGCQAYPSYLARLARDASAAEVAGAFLVNLEVWGGACGRMHAALRGHYGLSEADCAFFALFAGPADEFAQAGLEVIDAGLADGVRPALVARAARLLQSYELQFWDGLPRHGD